MKRRCVNVFSKLLCIILVVSLSFGTTAFSTSGDSDEGENVPDLLQTEEKEMSSYESISNSEAHEIINTNASSVSEIVEMAEYAAPASKSSEYAVHAETNPGVTDNQFFTLEDKLAPKYGKNGRKNFVAPIEELPSEDGWIAISDRNGLENIKNDLSGKYYLTSDIDLSGSEWEPIWDADHDTPFAGTFDGQGYVISNLTITGSCKYAGLFGKAYDAEIKNIGMENIAIDVSNEIEGYAGGNSGDGGNIYNCYSTGSISSLIAGGIVGSKHNSSYSGYSGIRSISYCYNAATVKATGEASFAGGISGQFYTIFDCYNAGNVTGETAGGIYAEGGWAYYCYNTGKITGESCAGGIGGYYSHAYYCYNTGEIMSGRYAGGIVGTSGAAGFSTMENCYNIGPVSSNQNNSYPCTGGIIGESRYVVIKNCYNAGALSVYASKEKPYIGAICGYQEIDDDYYFTCENCYWNSDANQIFNGEKVSNKKGIFSIYTETDNSVPVTLQEMKRNSTYQGFDFNSAWGIIESQNDGYPILRAHGNSSTIKFKALGETGTVSAQVSESPILSGDSVPQGKLVTITAKPEAGYCVYQWTTCGCEGGVVSKGNGEEEYTFICVSENHDITVEFRPITYTISISAQKGGTVTGGGVFKEGESVTLIAIPDEGYSFAGWYEFNQQVKILPRYVFEAYCYRNIEARFEPIKEKYHIGVTGCVNGTVSGAGDYRYGEEVTLVAVPAEGYRFEGWYVDNEKIESENTSYSFTVNMDLDFEARFSDVYQISVYASGGFVTEDPRIFGSNHFARHRYGEEVTLFARPDWGYEFEGWYEGDHNCIETSSEYTFTVDRDRTIEARFRLKKFIVEGFCSYGGKISGTGVYNYGDEATLIATPDYGYEFEGWYRDGTTKIENAKANYTFTVEYDVVLEARFIPSALKEIFLNGEVIIKAAGGAVPQGAVFDVTKIAPPPEEAVEKVKDRYGPGAAVVRYYEIRLKGADGEWITMLDGDVTICIKYPDEYVNGSELKILQENFDGQLIEMESWIENGYICYKTNWLETY